MIDYSTDNPNPTADPTQPAPPTPAPKDPWTADELKQSQNWANQYVTSHQIPVGYGNADDLGNNYLQQRRNGVGHQAAMDAVPGLLGWDKYQAPGKATTTGTTAPDYGSDTGILAQIAQWAAMPGADPSLKNDPNYWLGAIKSRGGLNAGNLQYWQDAGVGPTAFFNNPNREGGAPGNVSAPPPAPGAAPAPAPSVSTAPPPIAAPVIGSSTGGPQQAQSDGLFDFLMGRAKQSTQVDPNDPMIRSQSDNYSANLTRTGRQYLSELAERKGAGGNIGAESRMVAEKNAQAGAAHEGELVQHESDARRQEIEQALALGSQYMTAQQQMALQKELATIDANQRTYQTQVQDRQFGISSGNQVDQFGRTLYQNHDQFGRTLAQGDRQFGTTMSAREREFNNNLRQRAYEFDTTDEYNRSPYAHPA